MGRGAIEDVWESDGCTHPEPISSMYGRCLSVWCVHCDKALTFLLRFGREKTMDVSVGSLITNQPRRPVGQASLKGTRDFVNARVAMNFLAGDGADPEGDCPKRDEKMLEILKEAVTPVDPQGLLRATPGDFAAAWRGINCDHKTTACQVYGDVITLECLDCAADLLFVHVQDDKFSVVLTRSPLEPVGYGPHDAEEVVGIMREFTNIVGIPNIMADPMSDDPERDARHLAGMMATLERHGLLKHSPITDHPYTESVGVVSALSCDRHQFLQARGSVADMLRRRNVRCVVRGRRVSIDHMLEAMRMAWPCVFEGVGVGIGVYDTDGASEYCIRCGFDTLDDDDMGPEHWERGCPECGYLGYMINMHVGQAGRA